MNKKNRQLSMKERWEIDRKSGATFLVSSPQCDICLNVIKKDAMKCLVYEERKPNDVLRCEKECLKFESNDSLLIEESDKELSYLLSGIFGFCVGDALGVPVEFESREEREKDKVHEMRAYGTYHQYFGTWSDDTSLTLCLIDSLKDGYNLRDIANKFVEFYFDALWTPHGEVFDIGNTTMLAIQQISMGEPLELCGSRSEGSNGNGSLMRILPLAYYLKNTESFEKIRIIEEVSSLTHAHKRSKLACIIYTELAINLIKSKDKMESYIESLRFIEKYCFEKYQDELPNFYRLLNNEVHLLSKVEISSSGYVVDTLEAVIWSFLLSRNYEEAVFRAINLGDDTDTIAALVGGLAGIYYGLSSINNNWIQCLTRKKDVYELLLDFNKKTEIYRK